MTIAMTLLAAALTGSLAAVYLNARQHAHRIDRLLNIIITERASSDHRIHQLLAQHATDRAKPTPDTAALIALTDRMAQRLQAPAEAVVEHQLAGPLPPSPSAIPLDDDDAFWKAQEPMSKEALADALMEAETTNV